MKLNQGRTFGTRSGGVLNFSVEEHFLSIDLSVYLLQVIQSHWRLLSRWPSNGLRLTRLHHYNRMVRKNTHFGIRFSSVQSLSRVQLFATPWTAACQASLSITKSQSPPKPMSIELVMPSNHLILCCPLLLLPSIFPSIRVFSNESALRKSQLYSLLAGRLGPCPSTSHGLSCFICKTEVIVVRYLTEFSSRSKERIKCSEG